MRIGGKNPKEMSHRDCVVLPRGDDSLVFWAEPLFDFSEFKRLCPEPNAPAAITPRGREEDLENPDYLKAIGAYNQKQIAFLVIHSLKPSEIEWETVKYSDPETWANWESELKANNITHGECQHIFDLCFAVNSLDEAKLKEARDVFLRGPAAVSKN